MNRSLGSNALLDSFRIEFRGGGCGMLCALLFVLIFQAPALRAGEPEIPVQFNIPQQRADVALTSFAQQADITVVFRQDLARKHQANELVGQYLPSKAAEVLLQDSGLLAEFDERGHLTIVERLSQETEVKKKSWIAITLATLFASAANGQEATEAESAEPQRPGTIEEIVVTATKREASIRDIPASITALGGLEIERRGLVSLQDYLSTIPGVNMADRGVSTNKITIRGVNASVEEDSTVGMFFGEVPLNTVARGSTADLKMVDLERVEILRGPQGTLFGSGSMGGAVRNIPNRPNLDRMEGEVDVGYSNTARSGGANYNMTGVLNLPLVKDTLALRVVGYYYDYSGYVDNVGASTPSVKEIADQYGASVVDKYGVGGAEYSGARAMLLWKPTDKLSFTLMHAWQSQDQDGETEVNLDYGGYKNIPMQIGNLYEGDEAKGSDLELTNLLIEYDLGWGSILSSTSKLDHDTLEAEDISKDFLIPAAQTREHFMEAFVQEVRFTSQWNSPWQVIGGVYYEDLEQNLVSEVPWTGAPEAITETPFGDFLGTDPNNLYHQNDLFTLEQTAVFGELSYQFNEQWSALVGARWFDYDRRKLENQTGVFSGDGIFEDQTIKESDTSFKANVSYKPNEDTLLYVQWAEGFRVGRPITPAPSFCDSVDSNGNPGSDGLLDGTNIPIESDGVESDSLDSYELGGKFTMLDDRFQANLAIYHIDWSGIPVSVFAEPHCGFSVTVNAGKAVIDGGELETTYYFSDALRLEFGLAYTDAELAEDSDALGPKGTRLPGSSKWKVNLGMQYEFNMFDQPSFARFNYAYVDGFHDDIAANFREAGDYSKLDLRAGIHFNTIELELYGTNVLNEDAITHVISDPYIAYQLRPRTIGFDIRYRF